LSNLIGNALRHGGSARVSTSVSMNASGREVRVVIDDDGPGIAPENLESVFQPFYRVDPSRGRGEGSEQVGSGLGLYIASDLAARNGGRLSLSNRAGGGLRAELAFPLA
jgi:signal transduction histidine kinase